MLQSSHFKFCEFRIVGIPTKTELGEVWEGAVQLRGGFRHSIETDSRRKTHNLQEKMKNKEKCTSIT